jgi:AraC-like DNA-binding protein
MSTRIHKYEFKAGLPQEFEVVDLGQLYNDFTEIFTSSFRTGFYHIIWFQKGSPVLLIDFKPLKIKPDTILFLPKNTVQRFDKKSLFEGKAILFTDSFFCKSDHDTKFLHNSILFNDLFSVAQIQSQNSADLFADLLQLMELELNTERDISQDDILKNLLHNFLLISERERRKQNFTEIKRGPQLDYVILFKDLLETNYYKLKQVKGYVKKMNLTQKQLNQATLKILDKSPKQMIDERVILEAKRLIAHTNESIKKIGFELGFHEPTNFTKYFRKHTNLTPAEFREQFNAD